MTLKIEVKNPIVDIKTIDSKSGGTFELHQLTAWAHIDHDGYPQKVILNVEQGASFKPGLYQLADTSFIVGNYNSLNIGKVHLTPIPPLPAR